MTKHFDPNTVGFVYFIASEEQESVKIGFATEVYQRWKTLQTGNPDPLEIRMELPATLGAEAALHRLLKSRQRRLEWYWDRTDFMWLLEAHLEVYLGGKEGDEPWLTASDIDEQFPEFMELDGHRYPDENAPEVLAEGEYLRRNWPAA